MNIIYTTFSKKIYNSLNCDYYRDKGQVFSCAVSYQKMFKTFEVRKNCFRTIFAFLIISHVKIEVKKI